MAYKCALCTEKQEQFLFCRGVSIADEHLGCCSSQTKHLRPLPRRVYTEIPLGRHKGDYGKSRFHLSSAGAGRQSSPAGGTGCLESGTKRRPKPRERLTRGASQPGAETGRTQKTTTRTPRAVVFPNPGGWAAGRRAPGTTVAYKAVVTRGEFWKSPEQKLRKTGVVREVLEGLSHREVGTACREWEKNPSYWRQVQVRGTLVRPEDEAWSGQQTLLKCHFLMLELVSETEYFK